MCKSSSEGGQRCSGHARAAYQAAREAFRDAPFDKRTAAQERLDNAAADYASTPEGEKHFHAERVSAEQSGDFDVAAQAAVALRVGASRRAANAQTKAAVAVMTAPADRPVPSAADRLQARKAAQAAESARKQAKVADMFAEGRVEVRSFGEISANVLIDGRQIEATVYGDDNGGGMNAGGRTFRFPTRAAAEKAAVSRELYGYWTGEY